MKKLVEDPWKNIARQFKMQFLRRVGLLASTTCLL
jgi:hypothetical protein